MISVTTFAGRPLGDLATWVSAVVSFLAFGAVVTGLFVERSRRRSDIARLDRQRREDQLSAQARQVGAYLEWTGPARVENGLSWRPLAIHVTNASDLPVRNVQGLLSVAGTFGPNPTFSSTVPVMTPGNTQIDITMLSENEYQLQLQFEDDAGMQWTKYGPSGLTMVEVQPSPQQTGRSKG
jgi:hypothetical protein